MSCKDILEYVKTIQISSESLLKMMRAIGAKNKVIVNLYLAESIIIISRANLFIIIFGMLISASLKIAIDTVLKITNTSYNLSIPWSVIIISILVSILLLYGIGILFAYICTYKLSKKNIVSVLNNV